MSVKGYVAPGVILQGDVEIGEDASVWYQSVLRGDCGRIVVGKGSNIQDGCIVHMSPGTDVVIGDYVTVGHKVILHGCEIGDGSLIGMGSVILDVARIGKGCIIGAGALVTKNTIIPDGYMALGSPAKVKRALSQEEIAKNISNAAYYIKEARELFAAAEE